MKLAKGDRVRIPELPRSMSHFPQNCEATVLYSYNERWCVSQYGKSEGQYALDVDGHGEVAWYPAELLQVISQAGA